MGEDPTIFSLNEPLPQFYTAVLRFTIVERIFARFYESGPVCSGYRWRKCSRW